jgi:hypothetical protein
MMFSMASWTKYAQIVGRIVPAMNTIKMMHNKKLWDSLVSTILTPKAALAFRVFSYVIPSADAGIADRPHPSYRAGWPECGGESPAFVPILQSLEER